MSKVLFLDVDGVLFNVEERFKRARKPDGKLDWKIALDPALVALDVPIDGAAEAMRQFKERGYQIVLLTGRPEKMRQATVARLTEHEMPYDALVMRKDGDYRKSPIVKSEEVRRYLTVHPDVTELILVDDQVENAEAIAAMLQGEHAPRMSFYEDVTFALFCQEKRDI